MNAGRELDATVAEKVMGWTCIHEVRVLPEEVIVADNRTAFREEYGEEPPATYKGEMDFGDYWPKWCAKCHSRDSSIHTQLPRFSTDIAAAMKAVDLLLSKGWRFELRWAGRPGRNWWLAYFGEEMSAEADTASIAICRAVLKIVGAEVPA